MPLSVASTSVNGRDVVTYTNHIARSDTSAKDLFTLKLGDIPISLELYGATVSNAGTSALLSIGSTSNASYFAASIELTEGYGLGPAVPSSTVNLMVPLPFETTVQGTVSEHGTASTAGGPWVVRMDVIKT